MARKRGGIAGFYDRNKGALKVAVPAALSFIPGVGIPLAAAAGAAMGGDVEGQSYLKGLQSFKGMTGALRGGLEGYGAGKTTQSLAGGLKGLFAPKAVPGIPDVSDLIAQGNAEYFKQAQPSVNLAKGIFEGNLPTTGYGNTQNYLADIASRGASSPMTLPKGVSTQTPMRRMLTPRAAATPSAAAATPSAVPAVAAPPTPFGMGADLSKIQQTGFSPLPAARTVPTVPAIPSYFNAKVGGMPGQVGGMPMGIGVGLGNAEPETFSYFQDSVVKKAAEEGGKKAADTAAKDLTWRQAMKQPQVLGAGIQGLLGMLPSAQSRAMEEQARINQQNMQLEQQKFEMQKQEMERERARRQRIAELLMPMIQQQYGQYFNR